MANDIRMEFEEYIRELTQTISKEIFLEDLKAICDNYGKQLLRYEQLIAQATEAAERVDAFSREEEADIKNLGLSVSQELLQLRELTTQLTTDYERIFSEFSEKVNQLNQSERDAFVATLDSKISEYETVLVKRLEKEYDALFHRMIIDFEKLCKLNDVQYKDFEELVQSSKETYTGFLSRQELSLQEMQGVSRTVEQKLKSVEDKIEGIVKVQAEVLRQFSEKVSTHNAKEREKLNTELQQMLNGYRGTFAEEIAVKYEGISDKFRRDLAGIYKEYESQLGAYRVILQEVQAHNQQIQQFTAQHIPALAKLNTSVEENLKSIHHTVNGLVKDYNKIFGAFSERVTALNEEERAKFLTAMGQTFLSEMQSVQKNYEQSGKQWQDRAEQLLQSIDSRLAEQNQSFQQDRAQFLQQSSQHLGGLQGSIEESVQAQKQLMEALREKQAELRAMQQELVRLKEKQARDEETFHLYIAEHEEQQRQIMEQLQENQRRMAKEQEELWQRMNVEWSKRQDAFDKQSKAGGWKVFMAVSNILLLVLMIVFVFFQI